MPDKESMSDEEYYKHGDQFMGVLVGFMAAIIIAVAVTIFFAGTPVN